MACFLIFISSLLKSYFLNEAFLDHSINSVRVGTPFYSPLKAKFLALHLLNVNIQYLLTDNKQFLKICLRIFEVLFLLFFFFLV